MNGGNKFVILHSAVFIGRYQFGFVFGNNQCAELAGLGCSFKNDGAQSEPVKVLAGGTAGVGLLDSLRERTFCPDGHSSKLGGACAGQRAAGDNEFVFRSQRIALGIDFAVQNFGDEGAAAQIRPFGRQGFKGEFLIIHRHAQNLHNIPPVSKCAIYFGVSIKKV